MADDIGRDLLAKTIMRSRIAGDLADHMQRAPSDPADRGPGAPDGRLPVIIEGNAAMPAGAGQARRLLALAYARSRGWDAADASAEDPEMIARLTWRPLTLP